MSIILHPVCGNHLQIRRWMSYPAGIFSPVRVCEELFFICLLTRLKILRIKRIPFLNVYGKTSAILQQGGIWEFHIKIRSRRRIREENNPCSRQSISAVLFCLNKHALNNSWLAVLYDIPELQGVIPDICLNLWIMQKRTVVATVSEISPGWDNYYLWLTGFAWTKRNSSIYGI